MSRTSSSSFRLGAAFVLSGAVAATFSVFYPAGEPPAGPPAPAGAAAVEPTEALGGFDGLTNGFLSQEEFEKVRETFEEREEVDEGLGPVFNAQGCVDCHTNPTTGGISQILELRAGHRVFIGGNRWYRGRAEVRAAPGGSLIQDRAIDAAIQERVPESEEVRTFRTSLNTLGDGFIEAIPDQTILGIARDQERESRGRM